MGTEVTVEVISPDRVAALRLSEDLISSLVDTERILSTWDSTTEVGRLNLTEPGHDTSLSPWVCSLWADLVSWNEETDGAFDPAVGALIEAWDLRGAGRVPSEAEKKAARMSSGLEFFSFSKDDCRITRLGEARIDAGAFGKGAALDRLIASSAEHKDEAWLVNLGGQITVHGEPSLKEGWQVDLASPLEREIPFETVTIPVGSIAVSGSLVRDKWADGQRIGHIFDPRSGEPASFVGAVAVWSRSALVADILSTALFVMGPDEGVAWAEERGIAVCFLYAGDDGTVVARPTPEFQKLIPEP